jgi:hypothetical protein
MAVYVAGCAEPVGVMQGTRGMLLLDTNTLYLQAAPQQHVLLESAACLVGMKAAREPALAAYLSSQSPKSGYRLAKIGADTLRHQK